MRPQCARNAPAMARAGHVLAMCWPRQTQGAATKAPSVAPGFTVVRVALGHRELAGCSETLADAGRRGSPTRQADAAGRGRPTLADAGRRWLTLADAGRRRVGSLSFFCDHIPRKSCIRWSPSRLSLATSPPTTRTSGHFPTNLDGSAAAGAESGATAAGRRGLIAQEPGLARIIGASGTAARIVSIGASGKGARCCGTGASVKVDRIGALAGGCQARYNRVRGARCCGALNGVACVGLRRPASACVGLRRPASGVGLRRASGVGRKLRAAGRRQPQAAAGSRRQPQAAASSRKLRAAGRRQPQAAASVEWTESVQRGQKLYSAKTVSPD
jgi:hypothetical protein